MTMTPKELSRLVEVLDAAFQAEQAKMAEIGRRIDVLQDRLNALRAKSPQNQDGSLTPATIAGADIRWRTWAEGRRKTLNAEMARLMQEREARRGALSQAFGKLQAAQAMRRKLLDQAAQRARRVQL